MTIIGLAIGLTAGVVIGFLLSKSNNQTEIHTASKALIEKELITKQLLEKLEELKISLIQKEDLALENGDQLRDAEILNIQQASELKNVNQRFHDFKTEAANLKTQIKTEFKNIANEIVKEQSKDFSEHNQNILKPFKNQLESFEKTIQDQMKDSISKAASFKEQIEQLKNLNQQISQEANNLTNALKGDNKFQGNWGELILEKVLENSGLEKGLEYKIQVSLVNSDDDRIQPDAIVYLPEDKHIIIDSKVSLVAYEKYVNADNDIDRQINIKAHLTSLKSHIRLLSDKKYQTAEGVSTPDFILLFIPIEASFGVAVREDIELFNFAWNKNVVIVSPSTLLATLKTVASLWKQEKQNKNVLKIAEESGKLYDKFVGFVCDLEKIERSLDKTTKEFSEAHKKLHSGKGNILARIEKIKELGAKTTKQLDEKYLED